MPQRILIKRHDDNFQVIREVLKRVAVNNLTSEDKSPNYVKLQLHNAIHRLRFYSNSLIHILSLSTSHNNITSIQKNRGDKSHRVKSVQSALSDLLTTSATHGTFSRPSTKRGLILISLELNTNARESFEHC